MDLAAHRVSRLPIAVAVAVAALLLLAAPAFGAWSGASQAVGFSEGKNVVTGIDDDGTQQLGFLAPGTGPEGQGLYSLTRSPGASAWTSKKVFGPINNGRFAFARNGAAVVAWQGAGQSIWAAYRPAGKAWGSPAQVDDPAKLGIGPIPVISAKGAAAVVWSRKSDIDLREPDQIMYSATSTGTWNGSPSLLAPIAAAQPVNTEHFLACLPGSDLVAAMLPSGKPIAAWNDVYGSFKQTVTAPPGENELGACGVRAATPGASPTTVTPRPAIGWNATPPSELPFWKPVSIAVDPDSGRAALVVRGKASALTTSCGAQQVDYCYDSATGFETRALLGTEAAISLPGTATANLALVGLRNGFVAAATGLPAALAGGVGADFPSLTALSPNVVLTTSAIAVGHKGEAELVVHDGTKFIAYSAAAGGQFAAAVDLQTGSAGVPSVAIGCNGDALAAWNRGSSGVFAAVNLTGAAQCEGSGGEEEPGPGPSPTPTSTPGGGQTVAPIVAPPAPPLVTPKPLKCKKGSQKKTVRGKPKCVKKPAKGKKKR